MGNNKIDDAKQLAEIYSILGPIIEIQPVLAKKMKVQELILDKINELLGERNHEL